MTDPRMTAAQILADRLTDARVWYGDRIDEVRVYVDSPVIEDDDAHIVVWLDGTTVCRDPEARTGRDEKRLRKMMASAISLADWRAAVAA